MTISSAAWRPPREQTARPTVVDVIAFVLAVIMLLVFSQAWVLPVAGEKADPAASGLLRALFFPAYAAGLILLVLSPGRMLQGLARQPFLCLLMLIVCTSIVWSIAPDQTLRRSFAIGFTTLCGAVLATRYRWATLVEVLAAAFATLVVASYVAGVAIPSIGRMHDLFPGAWRGLWTEKSAMGGNMAQFFPVLCAAALLNPSRRALWWTAAGLAAGLVLLSTSKTALMALLLGAGGLVFVGLVRRGRVTGVAATWIGVVGLLVIVSAGIFAADAVFALLGKDATLTGRTKIWAGVLRQIDARPWLGYGYGAVWNDPSGRGPLAWITHDAGFRPQHAHNAWLEQWLGLGVVGLAAWVLFYLQTITAALVAVYREKGAYAAFPFLLIFSLLSLTESIAVTYNDLRWVVFVMFAVKLAYPDRLVLR